MKATISIEHVFPDNPVVFMPCVLLHHPVTFAGLVLSFDSRSMERMFHCFDGIDFRLSDVTMLVPLLGTMFDMDW